MQLDDGKGVIIDTESKTPSLADKLHTLREEIIKLNMKIAAHPKVRSQYKAKQTLKLERERLIVRYRHLFREYEGKPKL